MVISIFKNNDSILEQYRAIIREARELRDEGDTSGFIDCTFKAIDLVNDWLKAQKLKQESREQFIRDIQTNDPKQIAIAVGGLHLAIKRAEVGMTEPEFNLRDLNKNLAI